jgi:hypothetical protein
MSNWNYEAGLAMTENKVAYAIHNGTKAVWIIHPGLSL